MGWAIDGGGSDVKFF